MCPMIHIDVTSAKVNEPFICPLAERWNNDR